MVKGVLIGFAVMIGLCLIPIVHFVSGPASPFIAGYLGINHAEPDSGSYAMKGLIFGCCLGSMVLIIAVAAVLIIMVLAGSEGLGQKTTVIIWLGIGIGTLYVGSLSALGAMYSALRARNAETVDVAP